MKITGETLCGNLGNDYTLTLAILLEKLRYHFFPSQNILSKENTLTG